MTDHKTWSKAYLLLPMILVTSSLVLIVVSVLHSKWATLDVGQSKLDMGLFKCTNCDDIFQDWSWKCFSGFSCGSDSTLKNCMLWDNGLKASNLFFAFESLAFILGLLVLEKLILAYNKIYYGYNFALLSLSGLMAIFHSVGVLIWMILNQPEWPIDEDSSISEPTLYIQDGAIIALLNTALLFAAFFSICVIFSQVSESNFSKKMVSLENVVFKRTFQAWMVTVGSLASFALVIVLCVANYDRWVLRYSANSWWEGGLSTCKDCDEQIADLEWSCLAAITCYMSSWNGTCMLYTSLDNAYQLYFIFESAALICLIFFVQSYIQLFFKTLYGFPVMNYIYVIGIAAFNLIATVLWFHFSQAKFTFNCTDMPGNNEQPDLCSTAGPYGIFISNLLLVPMSLIYCMVFYNRSEAAVMIIEEKIGKLDSNEDAVST